MLNVLFCNVSHCRYTVFKSNWSLESETKNKTKNETTVLQRGNRKSFLITRFVFIIEITNITCPYKSLNTKIAWKI